VFDYQCESGWCVDSWKKCYQSGGSCYTTPSADCTNCPSSEGADLGQCQCSNPDFPNNWVKCNDGSGGYDKYDTTASTGYVRKENWDGSLQESDDFAIYSQCYHNKYRQAAAHLNPLKWNNQLAKFAMEWARTLKDSNQCNMQHSPGTDRQNLGGFSYAGENLYWSWTSAQISTNEVPLYGKLAAEGWYSEMKYFSYGGPDAGYDKCPMRNRDGYEQIGHLTQMLWDTTTDLGCDYALCNGGGMSIVVACVYGPGGNWYGEAPWNTTVHCQLNQFSENILLYGGVPTCDPSVYCW